MLEYWTLQAAKIESETLKNPAHKPTGKENKK